MAQPLDPELKKRLLLGLIVVLGGGYFGYTKVYQPRAEAVAALEQHVEQLRGKNRTARALTQQQGRSEVEHRLASYRDQLGRVEGLIPSSEELPDLLDAISAQAQRNGVELSLIQPVGATQEKYYTRRTYDLAVLGSYHQVGAFLAQIASLPRIVTPAALNVTVKNDSTVDRSGGPELEAKFSIETYVLPSLSTPPSDTTHAR
jgi:type IV pilus assembly protein PilO